jgi:hypothetical protein
MKEKMSKFIIDLLTFVGNHDLHDELWWRTHNDDCTGDLDFYVKCSDVFCWGTADCEELTESDLPLLKECVLLVEKLKPHYGYLGTRLFVAKKQGMRPQNAYYNECLPKILWPLFDDCGPERKVEMGNPHKRNEKWKFDKDDEI